MKLNDFYPFEDLEIHHQPIALSLFKHWQEWQSDTQEYEGVLLEVCRHCPEFQKRFFPLNHSLKKSSFRIFHFELDCYDFSDAVYLYAPKTHDAEAYMLYGLIPKIVLSEKQGINPLPTVGNFFPLFGLKI